ncbi:MAG: class I SAM-dependent methyltransferase [Rhizobiales bacterium]|nr:class I SAM-dependent methyltransferase [Hyphomicrobiales bacterium]
MTTARFDPVMDEMIVHQGVPYLQVLSHIAHIGKARSYLEIGTNEGFSLAGIPCASIAIDPQFVLKRDVIGNKPICLMYQCTSDDFFRRHDPKALLGGPIDLAFLDGMHLYEYLLRDFINTEKNCETASIIALHDCLPPTAEMTTRTRREALQNPKFRTYWTGDVWKTAAILQKYRPDLKLTFLDAPPTGLLLCTNLDPRSTLLSERYDEIVAEFAPRGDDYSRLRDFIAAVKVTPTSAVETRQGLRALTRPG